tara:strand:- start:4069 stop:4857 length:789 start_codon:yes stop_codon:yes gene_type:complete
MKYKLLIWISSILIASSALLFLYIIFNATDNYEDTDIYVLDECEEYSGFDLNNLLLNIDSIDIQKKFPYHKYVKESNYCNINNLTSHINTLDTLYGNHWDLTMKILLVTLTDTLKSIETTKLEKFNPQYLINKIEWAKKMKSYGECLIESRFLFAVIHEYWMSEVNSKLYYYYSKNPNLKYDYRFKYLVSNLSAEKYAVSFGFSKLEKLINYSIEGRFMYIWNRIYKGTNWIVKLTLITLILLTLISYITLILTAFKKNLVV